MFIRTVDYMGIDPLVYRRNLADRTQPTWDEGPESKLTLGDGTLEAQGHPDWASTAELVVISGT